MLILKLMVFFLVCVGALNIYAFFTCGADKQLARINGWRIPEARLLFTGLMGGCFGLLLGMRFFHHKTRKIWFIVSVPVLCVIWGIILMHPISALTLDRIVEYRRVSYHSENITQALDGYQIAFITDTHAMPAEELRKIAERLNTVRLDLLLLGGDFPSQAGAPKRSMEILSAVGAHDGVFGVEGNHDDYRALFAAMEEYGITTLSNNGQRIREGLYICGIEDLWNRTPDIAAAAAGAAQDDFVLLLAHNPDVTMSQDTRMVDLVLSGHTHGGQATFLGVWAPALALRKSITDYGQRFMSGWATSQGDGVDVYVSNGTGTFFDVPRMFARPQVILLTLRTGNR